MRITACSLMLALAGCALPPEAAVLLPAFDMRHHEVDSYPYSTHGDPAVRRLGRELQRAREACWEQGRGYDCERVTRATEALERARKGQR